MIFSCLNTQAHYNEAVLCLNFGTPQIIIFHLEQMENLLFLGVPILKHIGYVTLSNRGQTNTALHSG